MMYYDYHVQWFATLGICSALFCWFKVRPKLGILPAAALFYFSIHALWFWVWKENRYNSDRVLNAHDQMAIRYFAADSFAKLYAVVMAAMLVKEREDLELALRLSAFFFCALSSQIVLKEFISHGCVVTNSCGAILGNPSMNSSMMAVCLPIALSFVSRISKYLGIGLLLSVVLAVFVSKSSIGVGLLVASLGIYACSKGWRSAIVALMVGAGGLGAAYVKLGPELFNSSNRLQMWQFFMSKWAINPLHWWTGTGFGSFKVFAANLQPHFHVHERNTWPWLHMDWLESSFVAGVPGALLLVGVYLLALWRIRRSPAERNSLMLLGLMAGMNYPLHLGPTSLFAAGLVVWALYKTDHLAT